MANEREARFAYCQACGDLILVLSVMGGELRASQTSIPYRDAAVLARYGEPITEVWQSRSGKPTACYWSSYTGPSERGRLYGLHHCGTRP